MSDKYDALKLENQICFPMYACSREIIKKYKPYLDKIDLTYTQYITMMVMWEEKEINVKELGEKLLLDSGTLTPLLKKLEAKGFITRERSKQDERNLIVRITDNGEKLKEEAVSIPCEMTKHSKLSAKEAETLYKLLYKLLSDE
jgi:DNA-binding MarR family transcriptional regulator